MEVKNKTPESSEKDPKEDTLGEEEAEEEEDGNGVKKLRVQRSNLKEEDNLSKNTKMAAKLVLCSLVQFFSVIK